MLLAGFNPLHATFLPSSSSSSSLPPAHLIQRQEGDKVSEGVLYRVPQLPSHEAAGTVEEVFCQDS